MKKRGNLSFVAFTALIVVCCGASILSVAGNTKYNAKTEYKRINERYIAESGIDIAVGLFINYLSNRDIVLPYTKNEDGGYSVTDEYVPFLLEEIKVSENTDTVSIKIIENESRGYLASVGFLDFNKDSTISFCINTYGDNESFKLNRMCTEPDFLISYSDEDKYGEDKQSRLNPVYLTVKSKYRNGEVMANIKLSYLYAVRKPFISVESGEPGSVSAFIDTENVVIEYENYQNYRGNKSE